jgi:hypothetical protein
MSDRNEAEDLDDLLRHPGWHRLRDHFRGYWTEQIEQQLAQAVNDTDDALAAGKMRQVIAAKRAVAALLEWPDDRLRQLATAAKAREPLVTDSRRGRL